MNPTVAKCAKLEQARQEAAKDLLRVDSHSNVLAIGAVDGQACQVRIYVQTKMAPGVSGIPKTYLGIDTCVVEIGRFGRLNRGPAPRTDIGPGFPIRFSSNAPNVNQRASGTMGATVRYGDSHFLLSCNHILAVNGRVPPGSKIVSAQLTGEGTRPKEIATFSGKGYFVEIGHDGINFVDCALAKLDDERIPKQFQSASEVSPVINMKVKKDGAITAVTKGTIVDVSASVLADYSFGTFQFDRQILIEGDGGEFAWDGDSGSIVTDMDGHPVAMVFAEAGGYAVACPLKAVFDQLGELPPLKGKQYVMSMAKLP